MIMTTDKDKFTCAVCNQLYKNPVVHRPCGISFDRDCIGKICPAQGCHQAVNEHDLIPNYTLLNIVDEHRITVEVPSTYYLILLDTSTSMWYSDTWLPFATGESRFTYAIQILNEFFELMLNSMTDKISLFTFDTSSLQRFDFQTINETHLAMLQNLECDGKDTALFDCIDSCLDKLEQLKITLGNAMSNSYLLVLTDGGSNFGKTKSVRATTILNRSKKLHILGEIIQIGERNRKKSRTLCNLIEYKYNYFKGGNATEFVKSFTNSIKTDAQAQLRPTTALIQTLIAQLPNVPDEPIKVSSKEKQLA